MQVARILTAKAMAAYAAFILEDMVMYRKVKVTILKGMK